MEPKWQKINVLGAKEVASAGLRTTHGVFLPVSRSHQVYAGADVELLHLGGKVNVRVNRRAWESPLRVFSAR